MEIHLKNLAVDTFMQRCQLHNYFMYYVKVPFPSCVSGYPGFWSNASILIVKCPNFGAIISFESSFLSIEIITKQVSNASIESILICLVVFSVVSMILVFRTYHLLCILISLWVLHALENWLKYFFWCIFNFFVHF